MNERWQFDRQRACVDKSTLIRKRHTHINEFGAEQNRQETDVDIYIYIYRTTPQSGHYPITGWAHASRDSNFNCSCILIGIMRFTTDTHTHSHIHVHILSTMSRRRFLFDNDINIWNHQSIWCSSSYWFSFFFIKIRYFHINMWLLFSLPDVSIILTREQHIFNLLSNPVNDASSCLGNRKSSSVRNFIKKIRYRIIENSSIF